MLSSRLAALAAAGLVSGALAAPFLGSAAAADHTESATIQRAATGGVSVTDNEFRQVSCPDAPSTQDLDAHVFTLPAAYAVAGTTITLSAPSTSPHDFTAGIYNADCTFDRTAANPATFDLTFTLGADDTFLSVYSTSGSNIHVTLTATPVPTSTFTAPGSLKRAAVGVSVTDRQFARTCPTAPPTQGLDGYVFALPAGYAVAGTTVALTAPSTTPHDLSARVYNGDCTFDRTATDASTFDLTVTLGDGDTYLVVTSSSGTDIALTLTATPPATNVYRAPGSITRQAPTGIGATDTEFQLSCPSAPASQGVDGWVFTLPAGSADRTASLTTTPADALHDFVAYVYDADCAFDRTIDDADSADLSFALDDTDGFVSVITLNGANVNLTLTVS